MEPRVLDAYLLPPGNDYMTGSIRLPCVDTGIDIDRQSKWGRVYLSEDTVGGYARLLGWISPDDFKGLSHRLAEMTAENERLTERIDKLDMIRTALTDAGFVTPPKPEPEPVAPDPVPDPQDGIGGDEQGAADPDPEPEPEVEVDPEPEAESDDPFEYPAHQGAGWYLLSNGDRVRGKDDAEAAEAELAAEWTEQMAAADDRMAD